MTAWKMIGFPGAYAQYADMVEIYGLHYTRPPIAISNEEARQAHLRMQHGKQG